MNSNEWADSLRKVNCMSEADFRECFGEDGPYLWNKYVNHKNGDPCDFICYMDSMNVKKLYDWTLKKLRSK